MDDDRNFSAAPVGTGLGAALAGGTILATNELKKETNIDKQRVNQATTVAEPHEATGFYVDTMPDQSDAALSQGDSQPTTKSIGPSKDTFSTEPNVSSGKETQFSDIAAVGEVSVDPLGYLDSEQPPATSQGLEPNLPVDNDIPLTELNGYQNLSSASLQIPQKTLQRSKSKKEIVEEAIADSIGNNPQRGLVPGFWPETPVYEKSKDTLFE